jgi:hypothetical protein
VIQSQLLADYPIPDIVHTLFLSGEKGNVKKDLDMGAGGRLVTGGPTGSGVYTTHASSTR